MAGDTVYLLSALPSLGELGSIPPMSLAQLLEQVSDVEGNRSLLETLFLSDDLLQRQAFLAGEIEEVEPVTLTAEQVKNIEPLPEYLQASSEDNTVEPSLDALWDIYYRHAAAMGEKHQCGFLKDWVRFEVGMRNALALARAKALNIDPQEYLVAEDLGTLKEDFSSLINEWTAAPDPLAGLKVLDTARWEWLWENDAWFSFEDDELVAYGAKLMLLKRWNRLSSEAAPAAKTVVD